MPKLSFHCSFYVNSKGGREIESEGGVNKRGAWNGQKGGRQSIFPWREFGLGRYSGERASIIRGIRSELTFSYQMSDPFKCFRRHANDRCQRRADGNRSSMGRPRQRIYRIPLPSSSPLAASTSSAKSRGTFFSALSRSRLSEAGEPR